ncbi:MAG: hypothetical protein JXX29_20620 [Deltaproteobacteria bacterium]|nr:hypothetical protein [Deltaproteobacteria bacterium]MBN2674097.1 hypothetical protein [Deltaproteobacteria bacterium]
MDNKGYLGSWAWNDEDSGEEQIKDAVKNAKALKYITDTDFLINATKLVSNSSGAALALLMSAAAMTQSNGESNSTTECPAGYSYCATWECGFQCVGGYSETDPVFIWDGLEWIFESTENSGECAIQSCNSTVDCQNLPDQPTGGAICSEKKCCVYIASE